MNLHILFSQTKTNRDRSSRPEVFCKKGVLRNFTKSTGKHPRQSLFFNEVAVTNNTIYPTYFIERQI